MGELAFLGILIVGGCYLFSLTYGFAVSPFDKSGGAALFPRIVIGILLVFALARVIQLLMKKKKEKFVFSELFKGYRLFFFGSFVIYVLLLEFIGYIFASLLFLGITVNMFYRHVVGDFGPVKSIVIRNVAIVAFIILMDYFFASVLGIFLPNGMWAAL